MENKIKKTKRIEVRLSEEEYQKLDLSLKASNRKVSDFIREIINGNEVKPSNAKDTKLLREQIRRVGNNINQIAHNLNTAKKSDILDSIDYKDILFQLEIITNFLNRSYNECKA